ncbi:MAG: phosphoribosylformylglycinamidine cyclo-ligase [Planctomycetota bacterium]
MKSERYKAAGVDIDKKYAAVTGAKAAIERTFTPGVLSGIGSFGGLFDPAMVGAAGEVLVASADGVGTKLKVAIQAGVYDTVGQDLVNHCVNDILVQGARPLFFLDYVGIGVMRPDVVSLVLDGLARACAENGLALLGGETAEMPGVYHGDDFDLVGTIIGTVPRERILDGGRVRAGDRILALPSSGLHTNGYSLARKVLLDELGLGLDHRPEAWSQTIGEALLAVHRSYLGPVLPLLADGDAVHACAHITGGGLFDNVPRVLPTGLRAEVRRNAVARPPIFDLLVDAGGIDEGEAHRVFNMGYGFLLIVAADRAADLQSRLVEAGEDAREVGRIVEGPHDVLLVD